MTTKSKKSKHTAGVEEILKQVKTSVKTCQIVTFDVNPSETHRTFTFSQIKSALKDAGLKEELAKEFSHEKAFDRAGRKLHDEKLIDIVKETDEKIKFQFTITELDSINEELKHKAAQFLWLNKITGEITCSDSDLQQRAQDELNRCLKERNSRDITDVTYKLYDGNADLIRFRSQGGTYIVKEADYNFNDQIEKFLNALGGKMKRVTVPLDDGNPVYARNTEEIAASYEEHLMDGDMARLKDMVEGFTLNTKGKTLEKTAEEIATLKNSVEGNAVMLKEKYEDVMDFLDEINKTLVKQINRITNHRNEVDKEVEEAKKEGKKVSKYKKILGHSMTAIIRWCVANEFSEQEIWQVLDHFGLEAAQSTVSSQIHAASTTGYRGKPPMLTDDEVNAVYAAIGQ